MTCKPDITKKSELKRAAWIWPLCKMAQLIHPFKIQAGSKMAINKSFRKTGFRNSVAMLGCTLCGHSVDKMSPFVPISSWFGYGLVVHIWARQGWIWVPVAMFGVTLEACIFNGKKKFCLVLFTVIDKETQSTNMLFCLILEATDFTWSTKRKRWEAVISGRGFEEEAKPESEKEKKQTFWLSTNCEVW